MSEISIGTNQFAYCPGRGSRDALAFLVVSWLLAFREKNQIALYMSDVSAAFDRVLKQRLMAKLAARGTPEALLRVFESWLDKRTAVVVVNGSKSDVMELVNMVFQGTVWGPPLWNIFFRDASDAVRGLNFEEIVYADFNALKAYGASVSTASILANLRDHFSHLGSC